MPDSRTTALLASAMAPARPRGPRVTGFARSRSHAPALPTLAGALTAVALIFSLFMVKPSPFCVLDEVDAPLDDANVERYSRLVKQMSEHVQFIYITHNKIAMEMAHQLMGVTMHEAGVSRLVSVDVEAAAALAAL